MLENETSPYYQLLDRALRTCDRQTLKTFGINVGYEACSKGARRIREIEAAQGFNVPWALTIQAGSQGLSRLYLQRLVTEGTELGIRVFLCRISSWSRTYWSSCSGSTHLCLCGIHHWGPGR